jgi:Iron-containing redox enzyme
MNIRQALLDNPKRHELVEHPFLSYATTMPAGRTGVEELIGQWWHPLSYFPTFLSRAIAVVPLLEMRTAIAQILNEELGEGDPERAHQEIYVTTMVGAGIPREQVVEAPPSAATMRLIEGYETSTNDPLTSLGFLFGTETADLAMVSGIGNAVRTTLGVYSLPWVDIHVQQEPGHVENAGLAICAAPTEADQIIKSSERMWSLWVEFFSQFSMHATVATSHA